MTRATRGPRLVDLADTCCHPDCYAEPVPEAPVPLCVGHLAACARYVIREAHDRAAELDPPVEPVPMAAVDSVVYFVRLADRVKIGTTTKLARRLGEIPHDEVLLVLPGGHDVERVMHQRFSPWHDRGEWFRATDACLAAVAAAG